MPSKRKAKKPELAFDQHGFNILYDGIGNPFRIGLRVKYVGKKHPEMQFKFFKALNYVREYDRKRKCYIDTIELENGVWVETREVFAVPEEK